MAITKMMLVKAAGQLDALDSFISAARAAGDFHPESASKHVSPSMGFSQLSEENPYAATVHQMEELSQLWGVSFDSGSYGEDVNLGKLSSYIDEIKTKVQEIYDERRDLKEQLELCQTKIKQFQHFESLTVPFEEIFSCEHISARFGYMPRESFEKLRAYEDNPYVLFIPCSSDDKYYWGVYFSPHIKRREVDRIFAFLYFERIRIPGAVGTSAEIVAAIQENIDILKAQLKALDAQQTSYWEEHKSRFNAIYYGLRRLSESFELRRYAVSYRDRFYYICFIPKSSYDSFKQHLDTLEDVTCEISPVDKKRASAPVRLKNNLFIRPFEFFVSMYGLPSYSGTDVTAFVAITYTLIFGIMFGDVGQGFVLALGGYLVWRFKKLALARILIPCGISSMFFGFVFGSVFGYEDMLDPVYHALGMKGKPVEVMHSINTVLLMAIGIGVALVTFSMLMNIYVSLKRRKFGEALFSNNGLAGIVLYLAGVAAVYAFMSGKQLLAPSVIVIMMFVGFLILFLKEFLVELIDEKRFHKPESIGMFIMQNFFELIEYALSYFSNTLSFLRVGAFVLVHAGMMTVVFSLAGESKNIIVILIGNIFVIALEGLLTGIQVLRLEFYEMFSRFFEGDGKPFTSAEELVSKPGEN